MSKMSQAPQRVPQMPTMPQMHPEAKGQEELVIPERSEAPQNERFPQYGIIFTDSLVLADKYGCEVQDVYNVFEEFISNSAEVGQNCISLTPVTIAGKSTRHSGAITTNCFQPISASPDFRLVLPLPFLSSVVAT